VSRLVILSGPSCVGKGPLHAALDKFYPELARRLLKLVLYNSRSPRPGERDGIDYHFRPKDEISKLRGSSQHIVTDVRGDLQALDLEELQGLLQSGQDAFFEGNPFVPVSLLDSPSLAGVPSLSVFLSPLSRDEILYLRQPSLGVSLQTFVADVQRRKLLRRTVKQKALLSLPDLEEIERRCGSAFSELKLAHRFDWVIPNHDGEDSENWDAFY